MFLPQEEVAIPPKNCFHSYRKLVPFGTVTLFFSNLKHKRMKTVLRTGLFMALFAAAISKAQAQCEASQILIQNIEQATVQPNPNQCVVEFDLSFQMQNNGGNKYIFLHGWREDLYPDFFDCVDGDPGSNGAIRPPEASDLTASFINLGIDNSGPVPVLLSTYTPDPGLTLNSADSIRSTVLPNGDVFFVIFGVNATLPGPCGAPLLLAFDFWSSQAAQAQSAQCVNCHLIYPLNYIDVTGSALCGPLTFSGSIENESNTTISGYTLIYADVNGDGFLGDGVDVLIEDTTHFTINAGASFAIAGTIPPLNINQDVLVLTTITSIGGASSAGAAVVDLLVSTQCAPLPVTFKSFTAQRLSRTNVFLKWETSTEINNRGFALQRSLGNNIWEQVTFINSQSSDGNSSSTLTYTFNDVNSFKGISQYRVKQVDFDGRARYSEVRAVRGDGQKGQTIVYPVPSVDGRVNVVFDDQEGTRHVTLVDMNGRVVRQWNSITSNTFQIENLRQGVYNLRIQNLSTGDINNAKIVVTRN